MKILVSAIACNPYLGSENYFGWSAVQCLAQDHDLWVLTGSRNQVDLERAQCEGLVPANVRFIYAGTFQPWHPNRMLARLQNWKEYLDYSKALLPIAVGLHRTVGFDVAHHVTFATWRVTSPLWKLGIPFVFGPIGGAEQFPIRFFPMLSPVARAFEVMRMISNCSSRVAPSVRACIRNAAHVLVANPETERLIIALRGTKQGVSTLSPAFYSEARIRAFAPFAGSKKLDGPLRLFAGGNLEGRKGVALALQALARAKAHGVPFCYRIGGGGPEAAKLQQLAVRLGLQEQVEFCEPWSGAAYQKVLGETHVYLLPSFRESAGLTMMEAMLAGCVPVVIDCGGPAHIVTEESGFKIAASSPDQVIEDLTNAIQTLDRDREVIRMKGMLASARIASQFSAGNYRKIIDWTYRAVTERANPPSGA